jgi:aminocarboxymuconate-semialdehyde decarboxylase
MTVDIHAHAFPTPVLDFYRQHGGDRAGVVELPDGALQVLYHGKVFHARLPKAIHDEDERIKLMDRLGVETHALSLPPPMVYWAEPSAGLDLCQITNEATMGMSERHPGRFVPAAAVPLQDPKLAIDELRRTAKLGFRLVGIATNIEGVQLDDPSLEPFFAEAAALDMAVFVHPLICEYPEGSQDYRLDVSVGMTTETTYAATRFVEAGLLDRIPSLRVCWSHLGGYLPFIAPRIDYIRNGILDAGGGKLEQPFMEYFERFWFDCCIYSESMFAAGVRFVDPSRIVFGTDSPFLEDSTNNIRRIIETSPDLTPAQRDGILDGNPREFLKLGSAS